MASTTTVSIAIVAGVEGPCIYINDHRVAGNKPWGGGRVVLSWEVPRETLMEALAQEAPPEEAQQPKVRTRAQTAQIDDLVSFLFAGEELQGTVREFCGPYAGVYVPGRGTCSIEIEKLTVVEKRKRGR